MHVATFVTGLIIGAVIGSATVAAVRWDSARVLRAWIAGEDVSQWRIRLARAPRALPRDGRGQHRR